MVANKGIAIIAEGDSLIFEIGLLPGVGYKVYYIVTCFTLDRYEFVRVFSYMMPSHVQCKFDTVRI